MQKNPFESHSRKRYLRHVVKKAKFILPVVFLCLYAINSLLFSFVKIKDTNMFPTLKPNDIYLVKKYPVTFHKIKRLFSKNVASNAFKRFDVLAIEVEPPSFFRRLLDPFVSVVSLGFIRTNSTKLVLGRAIAMSGDNVEIRSKQIFLNGTKLSPFWNTLFEDSSILSNLISTRDYYPNTFISEEKVFMINDRWDAFSDSRALPFVQIEDVVGIISAK